jgi:hypothetical protein
VIYGWEAARVYAIGDYVAYDGNFYIANLAHTSSATFVPDLLNWNNAGGKDGKYTVSELIMDGGKSLTKVARNGEVVAAADANNTIATVGWVNGDFNGNRIITRAGLTGITGANFETTTIAEFLNKVFFPSKSPYVDYFRFMDRGGHLTPPASYQVLADDVTQKIDSYPGTVTVLYADWSPLPDFTFNYNITKQDAAIKITRVEIMNGDNTLAFNEGVDLSTTGTLTIPKNSAYTKLTLKITDFSNVVKLDLNTVFSAKLGVKLTKVFLSDTSSGVTDYIPVGNEGTGVADSPYSAGATAGPYLIERDGSNRSYYLHWVYDMRNDNTVTDIAFSGTPTLGPWATGNYTLVKYINPVTFPNSDATTIYRMGVSAKGDVGGIFSTPVVNSLYYQLRDKTYYGYLRAAQTADPQEADIKGLKYKTLAYKPYYSAPDGASVPNSDITIDPGVRIANDLGAGVSGFFTWAVPTYVDGSLPAPAIAAKDYLKCYSYDFGSYIRNTIAASTATFFYVKINSSGTNSTWYWVCVYSVSASNGAYVRAILSK